jgi:indole-3-glycerol phosphate synthase
LLIARALSPERLVQMMEMARSLRLEVLVEVRDEGELDRALECGATLIGVNNRDLETLAIDRRTSERLVPLVPAECVAISESGVRDAADVAAAARVGADAVLVGSSISAAVDPVHAVRDLTTVARRGRTSAAAT